MTQGQADRLLRTVTASLGVWVAELEGVEKDCPKVAHLLASLRQAQAILKTALDRA